MKKIALTEVFFSVQGEGYHTGRPAMFVRLAGCPLACEFAPGVVCDTPYQQTNLKATLSELFNDIIPSLLPPELPFQHKHKPHRFYRPEDLPMLIITGGEPTAAPLFNELVQNANSAGFFTSVETNATTFREGLRWLDWRSASPKESVPQTSTAPWHNHNPQSTKMDSAVRNLLACYPSEYRYVIGGQAEPVPPYHEAYRHYVSPAVLSDGSGTEWQTGFPGFAPGAMERCLEIVQQEPRWRISCQQHKFLGIR